MTRKKKTEPKDADELAESFDDLPAAIRAIAQSAKRLAKSGLNRRAIMVLIRDDVHGVTLRQIDAVLDSLDTLAERYTQ